MDTKPPMLIDSRHYLGLAITMSRDAFKELSYQQGKVASHDINNAIEILVKARGKLIALAAKEPDRAAGMSIDYR